MMRDCPDGEMRDLLPLFALGRLAPAEQARVAGHVAGCAECAAERDLLTATVRAYPAPPVDTAVIAARMPRYSAAVPFHRQPLWRLAASLTLAIVGVATVMLLQGRGAERGTLAGDVRPSAPLAAADSQVVATTPESGATGASAVVSGRLADLTDDQLEVLLAALDRLEGTVSADPEVLAAPIIPGEIGNDVRRF